MLPEIYISHHTGPRDLRGLVDSGIASSKNRRED